MVFVNIPCGDSILNVNRKVTVVVSEGYYEGEYPSRIEDVGLQLLLAAPTHKGNVIKLEAGTPLSVEIVAEDGVYAFDTYIDSMIFQPIPIIKVSLPDSLFRIQRRQFVRVNVNIPVIYWVEKLDPRDSLDYNDVHNYYNGHITDLSAGGARLITWHPPENERLGVGSYLKLKFDLPKESDIEIEAKIIRISNEKVEKGICHRLAVEFINIDINKQDVIAKYILECQYDMRRKGLL